MIYKSGKKLSYKIEFYPVFMYHFFHYPNLSKGKKAFFPKICLLQHIVLWSRHWDNAKKPE